jgi:hypothetical protein
MPSASESHYCTHAHTHTTSSHARHHYLFQPPYSCHRTHIPSSPPLQATKATRVTQVGDTRDFQRDLSRGHAHLSTEAFAFTAHDGEAACAASPSCIGNSWL